MKNLKNLTYNRLFSNEIRVSSPHFNKDITKPLIYVERTTSSIIAGADETIKYIKKYFDNDDEYILIETGSRGIMSFDTLVSILIPGRSMICFKNVYYNIVNTILDSVLNHILPQKELILGQISHPDLSSWPDVIELTELEVFSQQDQKLLKNFGLIDPNSLESYLEFGGYQAFAHGITKKTPIEICNIIKESKLRGRGGGAYLTGDKWISALETGKNQKYFICNADESDPASFSGRLLAESNPHQVIEGILTGAYAIGAKKAYIYIRNNYKLAIERLNLANNEAKKAGIIGEDIFGSGIDINIEIFKGPGAYVCGEETALIASLEGKRGMPSPKPPYPTESGLNGQPTVVNNIETISNIPYILLQGSDNFKNSGFNKSSGTKLFSVSGKTVITCVLEMPMGTTPERILRTCNNIQTDKIKAVHIGGPSGGFISPEDFNIRLDYETINASKLWLGAGSFLVLDQSSCILNISKYFIEFINNESCGKCIPCREGSQRLLEILKRITEKPGKNDQHESLLRFKGVTQLEQISSLMQKTSLCGLGQNAPNSILSGLSKFRNEYEEHIYERKCDANICRNLKEYFVDVDNCVGCGICAKRCPSDAILVTEHNAHFIISERCIKCGKCEEACKFNAIIVR
ncbi:MAG: NADH-quinone oxidoreductase subunit F [Marinilabiliales bacterium]|nr:MAG: NADH-quinone oxidoreductase subunit F [Marinilabiliales bacterium]